MKLFEITKKEEQEQLDRERQEHQDTVVTSILNQYKEGHIHYAHAHKQLVHIGLTGYQATQKLESVEGK